MPRSDSKPPNAGPGGRARARSGGLSRGDVVDAALRIVERDGEGALTMRHLADELGAAVTAIYWHVGNRDALLDVLIQRVLAEVGGVQAVGGDPRTRIAGLARELRHRLLARPHLIGLADQRGLTAAMFQPMQAALADELATVGLTGRPAGHAIRLVQCHVIASVVLARAVARSQIHVGTDPLAWPGNLADPDLVEALAAPLDIDGAFALGLEALLDHLLPPLTPTPSPLAAGAHS